MIDERDKELLEDVIADAEDSPETEEEFEDGFNEGFSESGEQANDKAPDPVEAVVKVAEEKADPIKDLEDRLSKQFNHLAGHIGGLNSRLQELQTAHKAAADSLPVSADKPTAGQVAAASDSGEKMKQLRDEFPEWADALDEQITTASGSWEKRIAKVQEEAIQAVRAAEKRYSDAIASQAEDMVESVHPGWQEAVKTKEFVAWYEAQPANIRGLAESTRASDAIKLMNAYANATSGRGDAGESRRRRLELAVPATDGRARQTTKASTYDSDFAEGYATG